MNPVAKALWFIESHFATEVTLGEIAEVAGVSRFHIIRAFGTTTGHSVMRYVRARRLTEAARSLADGAPDILRVALDAGYNSHEAFTRAFRDQFGFTPDSVRAAATVANLVLVGPIKMDGTVKAKLQKPRMIEGCPFLIAGLAERYVFDNLAAIPVLWQRFGRHIGHVPGQSGTVCCGACFNTDDTGFDYVAGVEVRDFAALPAEYARLRVSAQRYAVFTHQDHVSGLHGTLTAIFNEWLPASGLSPADSPVFERYDERFDAHSGQGGFEIWVPVET